MASYIVWTMALRQEPFMTYQLQNMAQEPDNGNYGNPTAGHTGPEVRPASILLLPVVTY